ncbi:hypothetical protein BBJ28_00023222, partial [Nothophytophthora sp. Chile5]
MDVTEHVREWLSNKFGTVMQEKQKIFVSNVEGRHIFTHKVFGAFPKAVELEDTDLDALFHATMDRYQPQRQQNQRPAKMDANTRQLRKREFTQPYIDDGIPAQFESYIDNCWKHYCTSESAEETMYPYTTIVQSSGFGKSRLLRELAFRTKETGDPTMKVLYVCVRQGSSSGYPEKTAQWRKALFPSAIGNKLDFELQNELSSRLQTVFHNAMLDWDSVGDYCFAHFTDSTQGKFTYDKLTRDDETSANRTDQCDSFEHRRILVLALDEARWLLKTSQADPTGCFQRLRRALNPANTALARDYGKFAGIFAVLVDTNSKISNFTPPPTRDPSSREAKTGESILFPPFVLTHTMDVFLDADMKQKRGGGVSTSSEFYREFVQRDTEAMRSGLADMGRPLWQQYKIAKGEQHSRDGEWGKLLALAAKKLVGGQPLSLVAKGAPNGLCGVAALLCRLGIRPYSWSPLASRVVADYMAVLSYVSLTHDQFVSSYSSEPILAFGAARVWYKSVTVNSAGSTETSSRHLLEQLILPELTTMLHREVLDTGGIGELVARIVLLLAMDATGVVVSGDEAKRCYAGEFYSVATFLRTLSGDSTVVLVGENKTDVPLVDDLLAPWGAWKVGFSHFVQLSKEPSEEVLWAMLARRAACAL